MGRDWVEAWLLLAAERIHDRRDWLTDLDAAIGDGDHGINLDRGFRAVADALAAGQWSSLGAAGMLRATGTLLLGTVGGASGALYGRAFQRAGRALAEPAPEPAAIGGGDPCDPVDPADTLDGDDGLDGATRALDAAIEAIAQLGHSRPGEKTMLDALVPAGAALAVAPPGRRAEGIRKAAAAAAAGAEATIPLLALKGRASYLGPRSIGHMDPGAASSALLLGALADRVTDAGESAGD